MKLLNQLLSICVQGRERACGIMRGKRHLMLAIAVQIFVSGCAGLAVTLPGTEVRREAVLQTNVFDSEDYLPREVTTNESVVKDKVNSEIRYYKNSGSTCYYQIALIPLFFEKCGGGSEVWSYGESNFVTITTKDHYIYGVWCSPIPILAMLPGAAVGVDYRKRPTFLRKFCDYHFGSTLYETNSF